MRIASFLPFAILLFMGSCNAPKLSKADEAFQRGEFFEAQKIYKKLYNKLNGKTDRTLRGEVAFKQGLCYERLNMSANASKAFRNAERYNYPDSSLYFKLGKALQGEGQYAKAIEAYETFLRFAPSDILAREGINGCRSAMAAKENRQTRYVVKKFPLFNSPRADYSPMFLDKNLDQIYFTSNREKATGTTHSEITGMKRGDIFVSRKDEQGRWKQPEMVEGGLNTEADEGIISFSPDGQTMYLTRARRSDASDTSVEIYTSRRTDASWSEPQKFEITADTISAVGHPAVSPDGTYLYFCSDMPGGYGGLDLWRINLKERAGSLENMGPQINTPGNEMFPYSRTDSLLYFSSDGHPGFGGLDLFKAKLNSTGDYWSVENMGMPMNSKGDDFGLTFGNAESGFFSSNRDDGKGRDHIYSFELPDIHISISGFVVDKDDEPVANAIIRIVGDDGSNQKEVSRDDGSFRFNLDRGVRYVMKAGATGYLNQKQEFTSDTAEEDADYEIDFVLASINKPQVIENIFYDFDKATLRQESKAALDELAAMMRENPHVTIELGAHTDRKGSDEYNLLLSERRAQSVIDYLISSGIAADRLSPKGYGESMPKTITKRINKEFPQFEEGIVLNEEYISTLSPEDQETADQINRRTEFQVLSLEYF